MLKKFKSKMNPYPSPTVFTDKLTIQEENGCILGKINEIIDEVNALEVTKQDKLIAGEGITIDENNVIRSTGGGSLPIATPTVLGGVKIGSGVNVAEDGTISIASVPPVYKESYTHNGWVIDYVSDTDTFTIYVNGNTLSKQQLVNGETLCTVQHPPKVGQYGMMYLNLGHPFLKGMLFINTNGEIKYYGETIEDDSLSFGTGSGIM